MNKLHGMAIAIVVILFAVWNLLYSTLYFIQSEVSLTPAWSMFIVYASISATIILYLKTQKNCDELAWNLKGVSINRILNVFCAILALQFIAGICNTVLMAFYPLEESLEAVSVNIEDSLFLSILLSVVLAPLFEEVYFRGLIFNRLKSAFPVKTAVVIQAVLFSVMHFNVSQTIFAFFIGCYLAWNYYRYNSLWLAVLIHGMSNAIILAYEWLPADAIVWIAVPFNLIGIGTTILIVGSYVKNLWTKIRKPSDENATFDEQNKENSCPVGE